MSLAFGRGIERHGKYAQCVVVKYVGRLSGAFIHRRYYGYLLHHGRQILQQVVGRAPVDDDKPVPQGFKIEGRLLQSGSLDGSYVLLVEQFGLMVVALKEIEAEQLVVEVEQRCVKRFAQLRGQFPALSQRFLCQVVTVEIVIVVSQKHVAPYRFAVQVDGVSHIQLFSLAENVGKPCRVGNMGVEHGLAEQQARVCLVVRQVAQRVELQQGVKLPYGSVIVAYAVEI